MRASNETLGVLRGALARLAEEARKSEARFAAEIEAVPAEDRPSARNLVHYVGLRDHDLRELQDELARLGLSSLGRCEAHVLPTLEVVQRALLRLADQPAESEPALLADLRSGPETLRRHSEALLGAPRPGRASQILVTLPSEAAGEPQFVEALVAAGMDLARINSAHDGRAAWEAMAANVRRAAQRAGRPCRVLFDLTGPKLRTGAIEPGPRVLHWRPAHDARGHVLRPARILIGPDARSNCGAATVLPLTSELVAAMRVGDRLVFDDCRARKRAVEIRAQAVGGRWWGESSQGCYVETGLALKLVRGRRTVVRGSVGALPPIEQPIVLCPGDALEIVRPDWLGRMAVRTPDGDVAAPARIPCVAPEVFADLRAGQPIWLDDGKIGGVLERTGPDSVLVRVTHAAPGGSKLRGDKGINLPESVLSLPALGELDRESLSFAAEHADLVGLSFARGPADLQCLQEVLASLGAHHLGIVVKIETRAAFEALPRILLSGLRWPPFGVMVARGDLAVESGFERLAEVQEEILWLAEAAHVPVIWATQVLEGLTRTGQPSRAEVTDAAMSGRAECVMLNKGPYVVDAVRFLDDVLWRMRAHQHKKRARLRRLSISRLASDAHEPVRA